MLSKVNDDVKQEELDGTSERERKARRDCQQLINNMLSNLDGLFVYYPMSTDEFFQMVKFHSK